jgi:hypothetical protein
MNWQAEMGEPLDEMLVGLGLPTVVVPEPIGMPLAMLIGAIFIRRPLRWS